MEIVYCDTCGFRVPEQDLAQGRVVRADNKVYCAKCAPAAAPGNAEAPSRKIGSKQIPAVEVPRRHGSSINIPAPAPVHEPRRAAATTVAHRPKSNFVPIAMGVSACVVVLGLMLLSGGKPQETRETKKEPDAPKTPMAGGAGGDRDNPPDKHLGPQFLENADPAKRNPPPDTPKHADPAPIIPNTIKKDDPETAAADAFGKLKSFDGLDAGDKAGRIKRLEEYVAKYGDTIASARARTMLDDLKKPDAPKTNPPPPPPPPPPLATPDNPAATQAAPKTSPNDTTLLSENFDGPRCDWLHFAEITEGPPGSNGKVMKLESKDWFSRGVISNWAQKPGWDRSCEFPLADNTRIRFRYYNESVQELAVGVSIKGEDKRYFHKFDATVKKAWIEGDAAVADFVQEDTNAHIKPGAVFNQIDFATSGPGMNVFYIDDLWIGNPAPAKPAEAAKASANDTTLLAETFDGPKCEGLHFGEIADGPPGSHGKVALLKGQPSYTKVALAQWALGGNSTRQLEFPISETTRIRFRYYHTNARILGVCLVLKDEKVDFETALDARTKNAWVDADVAASDLIRTDTGAHIKPGSAAIEFRVWADSSTDGQPLTAYIDDLWIGNPAPVAKAPAPTPVPVPPLDKAAQLKLESAAALEWSSINSLVNNGRWDAGRKAIGAFKEKYGATQYAIKKADELKAIEIRCIEAPFAEGLVGLWKFDEGKGAVAADSSGNNNNGKVYGAEWVAGRSGTALSFNGVDDYVNIPNSPTLQIKGSLTIAVWFKNAGRVADFGRLVSKSWNKYEAPWFSYGLVLDNGEDNAQHVNMQTGEPPNKVSSATSKSVLANGQWHHIVGVYDTAKSKITIYIDGNKENEAAIVNSAVVSTQSDLRIGDDWASKQKVKGVIDEVRLYNRALNDAEIKGVYNMFK